MRDTINLTNVRTFLLFTSMANLISYFFTENFAIKMDG